MRHKPLLATAVIAMISTGGFVVAQHGGHNSGHPMHGGTTHGAGHDQKAHPKGDTGQSSMAFQAANTKMHEGMDITFTGNADHDFAVGMTAHHEGAVAMAEIVLKYGKDPEIRKLAEDIIGAQKKEIAWMKGWLTKQSK